MEAAGQVCQPNGSRIMTKLALRTVARYSGLEHSDGPCCHPPGTRERW